LSLKKELTHIPMLRQAAATKSDMFLDVD